MRLFLAVAMPKQITSQIRTAIQDLKEDYPEFDWVPEKNYHLTIFFFGERNEDKLTDLIEGVERTIFDIDRTIMSTFGLEMFVRKGINIHVTFNRNKVLEQIHNRIISEIGTQIPQNYDKYIPHMSLAKYKLPAKQQYFLLRKKIEKINLDIEYPLDAVHLYESLIKKPFPEYRIIHTFNLQ